jgi:hypothetical protein
VFPATHIKKNGASRSSFIVVVVAAGCIWGVSANGFMSSNRIVGKYCDPAGELSRQYTRTASASDQASDDDDDVFHKDTTLSTKIVETEPENRYCSCVAPPCAKGYSYSHQWKSPLQLHQQGSAVCDDDCFYVCRVVLQ